MTNIKVLEKKIKELEVELEKANKEIANLSHDKDFMDALYIKAKELVKKHSKASAIFIQKHLMIDYPRATVLINKLRENGLIE